MQFQPCSVVLYGTQFIRSLSRLRSKENQLELRSWPRGRQNEWLMHQSTETRKSESTKVAERMRNEEFIWIEMLRANYNT